MKRLLRRGSSLILAAMVLAGAWVAEDRRPPCVFGVRAGFGLNPDQCVIGAQSELTKVVDILRFAPSLDFGFGNDAMSYLLNADLRLPIALPGSRSDLWRGGTDAGDPGSKEQGA